ncbi:MAG: tetratricopeptide repeat protein [Chitinispirillaceae bacterium]|nr:tetratricopeptide repeat protein [Chitinispirillaceae bacterium]
MKKKCYLQKKPVLKGLIMERTLLYNVMPYILISLLGLLVYFQSFFFNYVYLDDHVFVLDQQPFIGDLSNIWKAFGRDIFNANNKIYYRPVLTLSFILNAVIGGTHPFIYHLTNCLTHLAVCCLIFLLLVKLKYDRLPSLLFSLVFTVLPVLTQTVVWIPGRNDLLLFLFILLSFIFFLKYLEIQHWYFFLIHSLFFGLALYTKEITVALPVLCLYYLQFIHKEKLFSLNKLIFSSTWLILFASWFILRHFALSNPVKVGFAQIVKSVVAGFPVIIQYIGKIMIPVDLAVLPTIQDTTFVYGIIALVLLIAAIVFTRKLRLNFFFLGLLWFLLFLLPSFIVPETRTISYYREDRLYVPVLGFLILLLETRPVKAVLEKRTAALSVFAIIISLFSGLAVFYSLRFRDCVVFWESAAKHSPHAASLAYRNLGAMYFEDGRKEEAETACKKALALNPVEPLVHLNLGAIYMDRNLLQEAKSEFKKELQINPHSDRGLFNLGLVNYRLQNFTEAIRAWKEATLVNDMKLDAWYGLANAYHVINDEVQEHYYLNEYKKRGGKVE